MQKKHNDKEKKLRKKQMTKTDMRKEKKNKTMVGKEYKLDGEGPVDNRPSNNQLQHFLFGDMLHVTSDM